MCISHLLLEMTSWGSSGCALDQQSPRWDVQDNPFVDWCVERKYVFVVV